MFKCLKSSFKLSSVVYSPKMLINCSWFTPHFISALLLHLPCGLNPVWEACSSMLPLDSFQFVFFFGPKLVWASSRLASPSRWICQSYHHHHHILHILSSERTNKSQLWSAHLSAFDSVLREGEAHLELELTHSGAGAVAQWGLAVRLMAFALGLIATLKWFALVLLLLWQYISMSANFYSLVRANANTHTCTPSHTHS